MASLLRPPRAPLVHPDFKYFATWSFYFEKSLFTGTYLARQTRGKPFEDNSPWLMPL